jgi:hypothetical protein
MKYVEVAKTLSFAAWTVARMPRKYWWFVVPCLVAAFWPRLASTRLYDPDEFEHLHAAWCISKGQVPYLDYFEHHGPLTYYLLAPFVGWFGDTPSLLTVHRALAGFWCLLAAAGVVFLLQRRSLAVPGIAFTWLFTFPWFLEKAVEGRPDVPAMALLTFTALLTRRAAVPERLACTFAAGLTAGIASLFTQKVIFAAAGLAVGAAITKSMNGRRPILAIVVASAGFVAPWVVASLFFHQHGALEVFLNRTLITPATWPAHVKNVDEGILHRLTAVVSWTPGHLAILAAVLLVGFFRLWNRANWKNGRAVLWCGLTAHLAGAPFVPAYLQYYLLVCPIAAALVGETSQLLLRRFPRSIAAVVGVVFFIALSLRSVEFQSKSLNPYSILDAGVGVAMIVVALGLLGASLFGGHRLRRNLAAALVLISLAPGLGRYVIYHRFWNVGERQRQDLVKFGELPPGPVLDGFSGLGCLRPHVGYWWWINHHSLPLMRKEGALPGIVELIRQKTPAVVVLDDGVRRIGGVESLLILGYEQVPFPGPPVFVRRESMSR